MVALKTFFKRIRSRQRSDVSKQSSSGKVTIQESSSSSSKPETKSAEEELREEYQELIRSSLRTTRCLGDDLESMASSRVSRQWSTSRSVVVTHLVDDSDDDEGGLRFAPSEEESIFINLDECRDTTYINLDECIVERD